MKFRYRKFPNNNPSKAIPDKAFLVPQILIRMLNGVEHIDCYALIDSGAADCLFPAEFGENIGIEKIKNDREHIFYGIGEGHIIAYFHNIDIEIGGHRYNIPVGFTYDNLKVPLLGQRGFFDLFTITFDLSKEEIELKQKIN